MCIISSKLNMHYFLQKASEMKQGYSTTEGLCWCAADLTRWWGWRRGERRKERGERRQWWQVKTQLCPTVPAYSHPSQLAEPLSLCPLIWMPHFLSAWWKGMAWLPPGKCCWVLPASAKFSLCHVSSEHLMWPDTSPGPQIFVCSRQHGSQLQPTAHTREAITALTLAFPNFWVLNAAPLKNNKQTAHVLTIICTKPLAFKQLCCLASRGCGNLLPTAVGYDNLNYPAFKCRSQDIQFPPVEQGT